MTTDQAALTGQLRHWTRSHDPHVRAAVELLIEHGAWLRRPDFTRACIRRSGQETYVDWDAAGAFASGRPRASTTEMAVLDLAVALGEDRYRLSRMGGANSRAIAIAVTTALGLGTREPGRYPADLEAGA